MADDTSNGYEGLAQAFMRCRDPRIGVTTVRAWSRALPARCPVLDLGCGHGVISAALIDDGFQVHGVDASPTLIDAFRARFPAAPAECAAVEDSAFFHRAFDGVVAWGLFFLLPAETQRTLIHKVAGVLNPGGRFVFTAPGEAMTWNDALTGRESRSLGRDVYERQLREAGLTLAGEDMDEGDNHYYLVRRP